MLNSHSNYDNFKQNDPFQYAKSQALGVPRSPSGDRVGPFAITPRYYVRYGVAASVPHARRAQNRRLTALFPFSGSRKWQMLRIPEYFVIFNLERRGSAHAQQRAGNN